MLTSSVPGARKSASSREVCAVSVVFTQNKTISAPRTAERSADAVTATRSLNCVVSRNRPSFATASTNAGRPIKTTGAPARASIPPKYPPTAPAPTPAIFGQATSEFMRGSCGDHGDEAIDVLNRVVKIGRNANLPFAQADKNFFPAQFVVKLGGFFRRACHKAAIRPAVRTVERTGRDAAVHRQTREKRINQRVIVREDSFRCGAQNEFNSGIERGQIEIEVAGP